MPRKSAYTPQLLILGALLVIILTIEIRLTVSVFEELIHPATVPGFVMGMRDGTDLVARVGETAAQAGVKPGDRVISVHDRAYAGEAQIEGEIRAAGPRGQISLNISRDGNVRPAIIQIPQARQRSWTEILISVIFRILTPLFCLALGFLVAFQRPFDRLAWILLGLMASFSQASSGGLAIHYALGWDDWLRIPALLFYGISVTSWPIAMLWFATFFPVPSRQEQRAPWLKWLLIAPVAFWGTCQITMSLITSERGIAPQGLLSLTTMLSRWVFLFFAVPIGFFFFQLGEKSGTLPSLDARRRLKMIWIGASVSLTPMFLINLMVFIRGRDMERLPEWYIIPALLLQFLFPVTLAYVIVVQRAMDVSMAVRQGLQYTLARGGVAVVRILIITAVVLFTVRETVTNRLTGVQLVLAMAGLVVAVFLLGRLTQGLLRWVDRRFFREAYNAEQILADLGDEVRTMVETQPLLEKVATRICDSLHVQKITLLLHEANEYRQAYARGFDGTFTVAFSDESGTVSRLRKEGKPLAVYMEDPSSWTQSLESDEVGKLSTLETELVLPLAVKGKLHGFIALGRKQSEEPYSRTDVRLLQSVATQTGLALENAHLTAAVASEVAHRERLNRDLEIAREVQQHLFPQTHPEIAGLDYAGACRPAQGVGGDYYDFIEVPNGQFGIAIGDVSGKGIPAALLMASLQASLRGQAINATVDLASLMTNLNRLIFEASASNRYATFFYGQYDPKARTLIYVNAGHNAPMVLRRGRVIRLDDGGPVVGLLGKAKYEQATVALEPGDVLVGFTDGISEAMNAAEDEFGEERMIPVVEKSLEIPSQLIIERLFAAADVFAAGAPQHDDMTAIVVRVLS